MTKRKPRCQCCGLYQKEFLVRILSGEYLCRNCLHESITAGVCPHELKRLARERKIQPDPRQMNLPDNPDFEHSTEGWAPGEAEVRPDGWAVTRGPVMQAKDLQGPLGSKIVHGTLFFCGDGEVKLGSRVETDEEQAVRMAEADSWEVAAFEGDLDPPEA